MGTAEEDYRPVWLGYSPALTTGGTVSVTHNASYPSDHTPVAYHDASWGEDIEGVSTSSWTISTANNFNPSGNNLSLRYGGTGMDVFVLSDLNASLGGSAVGNFAAATSSNVPLEVNRTGLSRTNLNNTWYVGTRDVDQSPLPVELIKFSAEAGNYQTYLYWSTASEINSAYFTIERSVDGLTFKSVGTIQASGNSNQLLNYDFSDSNPHQGISYYRLKQTDLNGDVYYSRLVVINHTYGTSFDIYPNPANHQVHIITDANKNYLISLYNAVGQEISLTFSSEQSTIDISNLPEGVYILEVYDGSATERHKLVVKH